MYNIAICDDDEKVIQYLKNIIIISGVSRAQVKFYEFSSGEAFVEYLKDAVSCDLLILDMKMKEMDGNETALAFRKVFPNTTLVFCSGTCMPTVKSFEVTPFRYLLKLYTDERMKSEMRAIVKEMISKKVEPFIVGSNYFNLIKLKPSDIIYISIEKHGSLIHIHPDKIEYKFEKEIKSKDRIKSLYNQLKYFGFEYAHNSYIVNLNYIIKMTTSEVQLIDGTKLTISRSKKNNFREHFVRILAEKY